MRTKIICTIGPASESETMLRAMIKSGMDVARLNMSHGTHDDHARRLGLVRRIAQEEGVLVAIMADLQGPKFRLGELPKAGRQIDKGAQLLLVEPRNWNPDDLGQVPLPHPELLTAMKPGQRVLIDDGVLELRVDALNGAGAQCTVTVGGLFLPRKGVSVLGAKVQVSSLTPKDRVDLKWAVDNHVDAIALSFVRNADDIRELRAMISVLSASEDEQPFIVAKIEKPEAVANFAAILKVTDIVMVARGDLGVETSAQEVPFFQKQIIRDCVRAGVPVITATQMLQSMTKTPTPTRAEASDVANAVLDGTDAVMLSAESASGDYPLESVQVMQNIVTRAESESRATTGASIDWHALCRAAGNEDPVANAITISAVEVARDVTASGIVALTRSGYTARMMSRLRPDMPILMLSPVQRTCQLSAFMRNVRALRMTNSTDLHAMYTEAGQAVRDLGIAKSGQYIVIVAGVPIGTGSTNTIKVHEV
jgi:pyruvate kinase